MSNPQSELQFSHSSSTPSYVGFDAYAYQFASSAPDHNLVPSPDSWPPFELASIYSYTTSSSPSSTASPECPPSPSSSDPTPTTDTQPIAPPTTTPHAPSTSTRSRSPNHVPRPRNAFMIFRSEFWAEEKISRTIERDHRHISRIIAHCWNQMPEAQKQAWRSKADEEKADHAKKYPGYRFAPGSRVQKPVKRNVKRNGSEELLRCRQVAELLIAGKRGDELESAVKEMAPVLNADEPKEKRKRKPRAKVAASRPVLGSSGIGGPVKPKDPIVRGWEPVKCPIEDVDPPIFRSPLLPPSEAHLVPLSQSLSDSMPLDVTSQTPTVSTIPVTHQQNHQFSLVQSAFPQTLPPYIPFQQTSTQPHIPAEPSISAQPYIPFPSTYESASAFPYMDFPIPPEAHAQLQSYFSTSSDTLPDTLYAQPPLALSPVLLPIANTDANTFYPQPHSLLSQSSPSSSYEYQFSNPFATISSGTASLYPTHPYTSSPPGPLEWDLGASGLY